MLSNKRLQPLTEKIEIRLLKWLTLKRSPDDVEMLIKHEGAIIEVVDFKAGAPGVIQPVGIERGTVGLPHRIVPDGVIQHQRGDAVDRCLNGPLYGKRRAVFINFIGFGADKMQGKIEECDDGDD